MHIISPTPTLCITDKDIGMQVCKRNELHNTQQREDSNEDIVM